VKRRVIHDTAGVDGDRDEQKADQCAARGTDNDAEAVPGLDHVAIITQSLGELTDA
jgi:hypothetical protein